VRPPSLRAGTGVSRRQRSPCGIKFAPVSFLNRGTPGLFLEPLSPRRIILRLEVTAE
jgi:hypothetical protein